MHRFYLSAEFQIGGQIVFPPETAHQISRVLRLRQGEVVTVFNGTGMDYPVELTVVNSHEVLGRVLEQQANLTEPAIKLTLYLCLAQREKFEWMLQKCAEVGASAFVPVISSRSLVQTPDLDKKYQRWMRILQEASEQSGRGRVPELRPVLTLEQVVQSPAAGGLNLLAWEEESSQRLQPVLGQHPDIQQIAMLIGPEGGFSVEETSLARAHGWLVVTLGKRILRMETAAIVAAALILDFYEGERRPDNKLRL